MLFYFKYLKSACTRASREKGKLSVRYNMRLTEKIECTTMYYYLHDVGVSHETFTSRTETKTKIQLVF